MSLWSFEERMIVARCEGHRSWLTALAFDHWRCDDQNYRFASVGEDCRLLLWDFSLGSTEQPRTVSSTISPPRKSYSGLLLTSDVLSPRFVPVCRRALFVGLSPIKTKALLLSAIVRKKKAHWSLPLIPQSHMLLSHAPRWQCYLLLW